MTHPGAELVVPCGIQIQRAAAEFRAPSRATPLRSEESSMTGENSHIAPRNIVASASAAPPDSFPAIGCPGKKANARTFARALCAERHSCSLVLPTSVISWSGPSSGASRSIQSRMRQHRHGQQDRVDIEVHPECAWPRRLRPLRGAVHYLCFAAYPAR